MEERDTSIVCVIFHELTDLTCSVDAEVAKNVPNYADDRLEPEQGETVEAEIEDPITPTDIHQEGSSLNAVQAHDGSLAACKDLDRDMDLQVKLSIVYKDMYLQEFHS